MSGKAPLRRLSWWKRLRRDRRGSAAIELAVLAAPLVLMTVGTADYGFAVYQQIQVQNAAQAGAEYALKHGFSTTGITNAVTAATPLTVTAVPAPSESCGCPSGTAITPAVCNSACAGGQAAGVYVTVGAQATYTTIVPYPGIPTSFALAASSTVRIQ